MARRKRPEYGPEVKLGGGKAVRIGPWMRVEADGTRRKATREELLALVLDDYRYLQGVAEEYREFRMSVGIRRDEIGSLPPIVRTGAKVRNATRKGGEARAEPFKDSRAMLWRLYRATKRRKSPPSDRGFCRELDQERPEGLGSGQGHIVGYENILHHLKVAKREHRPGKTSPPSPA